MASSRFCLILFICALLLSICQSLPSENHESPASLVRQLKHDSTPGNSFPPHDTTFVERAISPEEEAEEKTEAKWEASVERGKSLMCLLDMDIEAADQKMKSAGKGSSQSSLTDLSDFKDSGWTSSAKTETLSEASAINDAFESWGYNLKTPVSYFTLNQNDNYSIGTSVEKYPATKASFLNYYDPSDGLILYASGTSPAAIITKEKRNQPLPALHNWSDLVFLTMATMTNPKVWTNEVKSLKTAVMLDIHNPATKVRTEQALEKKGVEENPTFEHDALEEPPTFTWDSTGVDLECFQALLGTPLLSGLAWLLIQHKGKDQLGVKHIKAITPLYPTFSLSRRGIDTDAYPFIRVDIEDVSSPEGS